VTAFLTLLLVLQSANAPQPPTQTCMEILADSEGEMGRAQDPAWRRKAIGKLSEMRAEHDRYRASIDRALARNAKARDQLHRRSTTGQDWRDRRRKEQLRRVSGCLEPELPDLRVITFGAGRYLTDLEGSREIDRIAEDQCVLLG
jgi:hypothetical protein